MTRIFYAFVRCVAIEKCPFFDRHNEILSARCLKNYLKRAGALKLGLLNWDDV